MKNKKILMKQIAAAVIGIGGVLGIVLFCYISVEKMIIEREQTNMKSLAKVNAQSLLSILEAKSNLVYVAFSGEMSSLEEIETGVLKLGERCEYVPLEEKDKKEAWEQQICGEVLLNPGKVITGPVAQAEEGHYVLYMTKAISMHGRITGYVQVQLDLDNIYVKEQALSALETENGRYCIVKDADGMTVMPGGYDKNDISLSHKAENDCTIEWVYEMRQGTPVRTRKLVAYETITVGNDQLFLYIIENYDKVIQPLERISLYFCLIGLILLAAAAGVLYKLRQQHKKETQLVKELQHEKTLNETMKKQEGLMQKYNHSKTMGVLTGSIAHEFNNLMTPIALYAELLEENDVVRKEMPDEISELKNSAIRCGELARQLLDYSRQGRAEKVMTDYDAVYAMNEAVNIVRKLLPSNIELQENICKTTYEIHGQVGTLNQIVLNLATNAVHAMKDGGVLKIQFGLSTDDEKNVRLIVEDTGGGIPQQIQQKVFQPFFTTKEAGEGTGIGLTVVKRLAEEHGGSIRVKTERGEGTTFIIDFPRVMKKD